jgi:hypothetical protein
VELNRDDADFRILDMGVDHVRCRSENVAFVVSNGYVVPEHMTAAGRAPAAALSLRAQPNPFNPSTTIFIDAARRAPARVTIYDVAGRRVRALWEGTVDVSRALAWDGRDDHGDAVSSGIYFVRVVMPSATRTLKLTLVK